MIADEADGHDEERALSRALGWYGVMMATAFIVGLWTASRRGLRDSLLPRRDSSHA